MKKILIFIFVIILLGCQSEGKDYQVIVPNGTPSIAQSYLEYQQSELNYQIDRVSGPQSLIAAFTSESHEIIIAPINLGANMYQKESHYQLAGILTWGNLQFVSHTPINDLSDLEDQTIIAFGEGTVNQMIVETVIDSYEFINPPTLDYRAGSTQESMTAFLQAENQIAVLAEPTTSIANTMTEPFYRLDIADYWEEITGQSSFPQAGVFVNKRLTDEQINTYLNLLDDSVTYVLEHPDLTADHCQIMNYPFSEDIISSSINELYYELKLSAEIKSSLSDFIEMIYHFNPKLIGDALPDDDFYWIEQ